jgi:hypothetical protein
MRSLKMNVIPAQEIKRRGIAAVDDRMAGELHVIRCIGENSGRSKTILSI